MRHQLSDDEKRQIAAARLTTERASFPGAELDVIVEDFTYANGEPNVRVISHGAKDTIRPTG